MSEGSPERKSQEEVFRGWVGFIDGQCWPSRKQMGEEVFAAFGQFCHYSVTFGEGIEVAKEKAAQGAAEFERITGFKAKDFLDFIGHAQPLK